MTATDITTPEEFRQWVLTAEPGQRITYYMGYLAEDREDQPILNELAALVYEANQSGFVELSQLRICDQVYAYRAHRTEEIVG